MANSLGGTFNLQGTPNAGIGSQQPQQNTGGIKAANYTSTYNNPLNNWGSAPSANGVTYLNLGGNGGQPLSTIPTSTGATDPAQQQAAAAAAAKAAQDAKIQTLIDTGQSGAISDASANTGAAGANYTAQGNQLGTNIATGQSAIDQARKNIGMTQINSIKSLMDTIKQGLHGTGVNLGNTNALDSSAAGAAARAYANYGNVQTNSINNQAAVGNGDQDVAQGNLNLQKTTGLDTLKAFRDQSIADIQNKATQALNSLRTSVAYLGGDGSKVNVEGIKQQILDDAQNKLALVDNHIQSLMGGINPSSADQTAQAAYQGVQSGVVPSGPGLNYDISPNGGPQSPGSVNGGADTSLIPLAVKARQLA